MKITDLRELMLKYLDLKILVGCSLVSPVSVGETGALETWGTSIILRFVRHLVNDTKTNQFRFSTLLDILGMHVSLGPFFTWKVDFWDDQYLVL